MKSATIHFTGPGKVEISEEEVQPPAPGEVLIEADKSLLSSGTESICLHRLFEPGTHWDEWVKYPFRAGYSHVGRIVEMGPQVKGWKSGDRVFSTCYHGKYVAAECHDLVSIPEAVDSECATWTDIAKTVQAGVRRAEPKLGDNTAVIGLGPLGQLAIRYLHLLGPRELIAIDPLDWRLELAREGGATRLVAANASEALLAVEEHTGGHLADAVYDITGNCEVLPSALKLVRTLGTLSLVGDTGYVSKQHLSIDVLRRGLKIVGTHASTPPLEASDHTPWSDHTMKELFLHYLVRGDMSVKDLITHRFPPSQAAKAYGLAREKEERVLGVVFDWSGV
jgi:2-desacetyl-2-hydroxyethyl bacteriochlorophyllide A dehydrogenase